MLRSAHRSLALFTFAFSLVAMGCPEDDGPIEEAGERLDDAVEEAGDAVEDTADDVEDAVSDK